MIVTTEAFIHELIDLGIKVTVEDGKLRVRAAKGVLTPDRQRQLKERKEEIIAFFEKTSTDYETARRIMPTSRDQPLPLSFAQQRLWLVDRLEPGAPTYNIPAHYPLSSTVDPAVLGRTLGEVVRRHEVLRTCSGVGKLVDRNKNHIATGIHRRLVDTQRFPIEKQGS